MTRLGFVSAVVATFAGATVATTQSAGVPKEFPPVSFAGNQFVDSEGCAFIRAGRDGVTNWVPRVDRRREQLCNFQPTFAVGTEAGPPPVASAVPVAPLDAPIIEISGPPPTAADAPNPLRRLFGNQSEDPIETVASLPAAPIVAPAPVPAPRAVVSAPAPVEVPEIAAPAPTRVTLAEVCDGQFGIQAGYVNTNGEPIDCGPAPVVAQASAPVAAPVQTAPATPQLTRSDVCDGKFGVQAGFISSTTGSPIDCGPAPQVAAVPTTSVPSPDVSEPRRISLAEACAEIGTTGYRYISAQTGEAIVCPNEAPTQVARAPQNTVPAAPVQTASVSTCGNIPGLDGFAVRCGPQQSIPHDQSTTRVAASGLFGNRTAVPASNPVATPQQNTQVAAGNERVWGDGRLNANRGLPTTTVAKAPVSTAPTHRYVQVATFSNHTRADQLIQQLGATGFAVGAGQSRGNKIVALGPFRTQADMQRALRTVRGMGYSDAFLRN